MRVNKQKNWMGIGSSRVLILKMTRYFFLATLCWSVSSSVSAQDAVLGGTAPDAKMLPTAGSGGGAGLEGIYSPNLFNGTLDVDIPIYSYKREGAEYGLSLGYNTLGVKLDEAPTSIGTHWNIKTAGSIQRVVKDLPDELALTFYDTITQNSTQKFYAARGRLASAYDTDPQAADLQVYRDHESDDFLVSIGNTSFTFNIGRSGGIFTNPARNVKVEPLRPGGTAFGPGPNGVFPSLEFQVTDEAGNVYHFVLGDKTGHSLYLDVNQQQTAGSQLGDYTQIDRWVVDKITLANGDLIDYTYTQEDWHLNTAYKVYAATGLPLAPAASEVRESDYKARLGSISYPNGVRVDMVYDAAQDRCDLLGGGSAQRPAILSSIRVNAPYNCLVYKLYQVYSAVDANGNALPDLAIGSPCNYNYTGSFYIRNGVSVPDPFNECNYRLKLNKITLLSCEETQEEPYYAFTYDPKALPKRFRASKDWFGYYNGKSPVPVSANPSNYDPDLNIPLHNDPGTNASFGLDRTPDINFMKAGILTSVTNGYGGKATFTYAANTGYAVYGLFNEVPGATDSRYMGKDALDGLCIKTITETDPFHAGNTRVTTFGYSEGFTFIPGGYFCSPTTINNLNLQNFTFYNSEFLSGHHLVQGANHGYSKVLVTVTDNNGQLLSKKEISFSNIADTAAAVWRNSYLIAGGGRPFYGFPYADKQYIRDWELGLPLTLTDYDANGNKIQATTNRYAFTLDTVSAFLAEADGVKTAYLNGTGGRVAVTDAYKPYTGKAQLASSVVRKYVTDNSVILDSLAYSYDDHNNVKKIITFNSKGDEVHTIHYYNYEVSWPDPVTGIFIPLKGIESLVGTQRWKRIPGNSQPVDAGGGLLLDAYFNGYTAQGTAGSYNKIWSKSLYNLRSGAPLTYSQYLGAAPYNSLSGKVKTVFAGTDLPGFRKTSEVTLFDSRGNPNETRLQGQEVYRSMMWDPVSGQKLAEADCRYSDIGYTGFESANPGSFSYNAAQVMSVTDAMGGRKAYWLAGNPVTRTGLGAGKEYIVTFWANNSGNIPSCTMGGTAVALTAGPVKGNYTFYEGRFTAANATQQFKLSSTLNFFIDELRLFPAAALLQSWNHDALLGQTSATDGSGRITYFEYDKMGRPAVVRDQEGNILSKTQFTVNGAE